MLDMIRTSISGALLAPSLGNRRFAGSSMPSRFDPAAPVIGRIGTLETRLARSPEEVRAAQALRYDVFFREMAARPNALERLLKRDRDEWDRVCDHLLVIDTRDGCAQIVGTYRFLRASTARDARIGFYSQSEFDLQSLVDRHRDRTFLELGRSCVLPQWRDKRTVELLWHGIWSYVLHHRIDVLTGCASFSGTRPQDLADPLSFLFHHAAVEERWSTRATCSTRFSMKLVDREAIAPRRAMHALPPLIKGYMRLGARFCPEAVIDHRFGTTDVFVVLPVEDINPRYVEHYGADAGRYGEGGRTLLARDPAAPPHCAL